MLQALLLSITLPAGTITAAPSILPPPYMADDPQSKAEIKHEQDLKNDIETGKKYAEKVEKELKMSKDDAMLARVQRVGGEIAEIARKTPIKVLWGDKRLNPFPYQFKVVQDPDVNAFSLPGGFIYVNEGLLKFVETDDELAGVLAHEIGHAAMRHLATLEHESSKMASWSIPAILVAIFAGGKAAPDAVLGLKLFEQAKSSGWSQNAESAADYAGLQFMIKSRYNPTGILTFMERLARSRDIMIESAVDLGIFRTHPPSKERAEKLIQEMTEAGVPVQRSAVTTSFAITLKKMDAERVEAWFGPRRIYTFTGKDADLRAQSAASHLNRFFDQTPEMFEIVVRPDGSVVGRNKVLFKIEPQDAAFLKMNLDSLQSETSQALKRSVSYLSMVWLAR